MTAVLSMAVAGGLELIVFIQFAERIVAGWWWLI